MRWVAELINVRHVGALLCAAGLAALAVPSLAVSAIGIELVAAAFWLWARAAPDAGEQLPRWSWLRRPAQALWLAAGVELLLPLIVPFGAQAGTFELLRRLEAVAVVWAGLELLAALPMARPYSDLPGPLLALRPWLPALLPAAGFALLWRHQAAWVGIDAVRDASVVLLLVTALLAALRAFGRLQRVVSLRWLLVSDGALAALLIGIGALAPEVTLMLWLAACGGRIYLIAGELRGAAPRRGLHLSRLWRLASWVASAGLAWPTLASLAARGSEATASFVAVALASALTSWIIVTRLGEAPERRLVTRPGSPINLHHLAAVLTLAIAPVAFAFAWRAGPAWSWPAMLVALTPPVFAGWAGVVFQRWRRRDERTALLTRIDRMTDALRGMSLAAYRGMLALERRLVGAIGRVSGVLTSPARDLHTGDAQEYLLLLVGLSVFALVVPLLQ